jgi:CRP-like cAMP-binding protein
MSSPISRALAQTQVFAALETAALQSLGESATPVRVPAGQHLFHAGDPAESFFWLESGAMRLYRLTYDGEEKVFQMSGDGDLVAETAMFIDPCYYPLSAQAESDCMLHRLPRSGLLALVRQSPDLASRFLAAMSERLYQAVNRIDQLTVSSGSQRLVLYLIDLHHQQRSRWLTLPVNAGVLARQLNIAPETLSRQLHRFKQAGLISGQRREWVLLDVEGLCRAVGLPVAACHNETDAPASSRFACCNFR